MAITKLVLDRQASGQVFTFGSGNGSADVTLALSSSASSEDVLLTNEGSADIYGNLFVGGNISFDGGTVNGLSAPTNSDEVANKGYVDSEVSAVSSSLAASIDGAVSDLSSLESRVSTAEGDIDALYIDSGSFSIRVSALESDMSTAQSDISSLEGRMDTAEGNISTLQSDVSTLQSDVSTAQSDISSLEGRMDTAESNISSLQSDASTLFSASSSFAADIISLDGRLDTAEGNISSLQSDMSTAQSDISNLQTSLGDYALLSGGNTFVGVQEAFDGIYTDDVQNPNGALVMSSTDYTQMQMGATYLWLDSNGVHLEANENIATFDNNGQLTVPSLVVSGDLTVQGTQTIVDSTVVNIGDNIISLNGAQSNYGGIEVTDVTAPSLASGSLLWNSTTDVWIAGKKGEEKEIVTVDTLGGEGDVLTMVSGAPSFAAPILFRRATVSGSQDGSNKSYVVLSGANIVENSEQVVMNGIILMPGSGSDYLFDGSNLQFNAGFPAPLYDDNLQFFCAY